MPLFGRTYASMYNQVSLQLGLKERINLKKNGIIDKFVFVDENGREQYESFFYNSVQIYADGYCVGRSRGYAEYRNDHT